VRRLASVAILCWASSASAQDAEAPESPIGQYFGQLERMGLLDADTGSKDTLIKELDAAEKLLREGDAADAAISLYAIVETPRYEALTDFVEFQNAEYYLGVALFDSGAYGAALDVFDRVLRRGPDAPYWGPAHRRVVDIGIETRDHDGALARLVAADQKGTPIPPSAAGERAYLRGRAAYDAGKWEDADTELATVSKKSRLYSSALYLRGVMQTRRGNFKDAADAFCEIADTPDQSRYTFVVDDRYFTVKDLARLGLGRIAHEEGEYDDAYYHYFQVPSDSPHVGDALFEASWSMYQKRELTSARTLVRQFLDEFPSSPLWGEANLLAGYVELADCKFDDAQAWYDDVAEKLEPVVAELDRVRQDDDARSTLFDRALGRWRDERAGTGAGDAAAAGDVSDQALALLRLDPDFVRLHDAVAGMRRAAGETPGLVRQWSALAKRVRSVGVGAISAEASIEQEDKADADALAGDLDALADEIARSKRDLRRGKRNGSIPAEDAKAELERLDELSKKVSSARAKARDLAEAADAAATESSEESLRPLIKKDVEAARRLDRNAQALLDKLEKAADDLAQKQIDGLYRSTKRISDKARLGKIDAVIGQKQALDISVTDLSNGRFPAELHGRLWDEAMIGDDEEVWPDEAEYWADEYSGWR
jgi:TolA-binding protein